MNGIDIVIPTLGRAHALAPLVANIRAVTPAGYGLLFVIDHDDDASRTALKALDPPATVLIHDGGYPTSANAGYAATTAPLVLIAGDDVVFHAGWYEAAREAFADPRVCVVAPNDLSPLAGTVATMPIVRRSYIDEHGGAFGEPGRVYHEGYHHNWTDTELWDLAVTRGVHAYLPGCVIEHCHPDWGKATVDDTYRRGGLANKDHDHDLFRARRAAWAA